MSKNLKLTYILFFAFSAVILAWRTLLNFFNGVAINFVGIIGLLFVVLFLIFQDKNLFKRIKDLFFIACGFCVLELIVYFVFEFGCDNINVIKGFLIYQNVITAIGLLFFAYIAFRFICEYNNKKIKFIEIMLGNEKSASKKGKKAKELTNGSLEDKPNNKIVEEPQTSEENVVIIETEE